MFNSLDFTATLVADRRSSLESTARRHRVLRALAERIPAVAAAREPVRLPVTRITGTPAGCRAA